MTDAVAAPADTSAAVVAAPAPAVVAPVVPQFEVAPAPAALDVPKPVADKVEDQGPDVVAYEPTGDVGLDMALEFVGNLGISDQDPAMIAAMEGNFDLIVAKLASLGTKATGYEKFIALAQKAAEGAATKANEVATATQSAVWEAAGGEAQWTAISEWAKNNADPDEKAELNKMFNAGPIQARAAATMLAQAYAGADGVVINPADPTANRSAASAASANGALSLTDYTSEVQALHRRLGGRMDDSPEYKALQARRAAFRG